MIVALEAWHAGLFARSHWLRNVVSGFVVGVLALPLAMAFAIASGAKPEQGIYTAIIAGLVVSLAGGSRLQIAGPTGAFIVILSGITARHGVEGLQIATLLAGLMLLLLGLARFGAVIRFIPQPVIVGFTAGIGVIIWVGQWPAFFGLPSPRGEHFHEKFLALLHTLPSLHLATTLLALGCLLLVILTPRIPVVRKLPGPLIALLAATALQYFAQFEGIATIGSAYGGIPQGLPAFHWPAVTLPRVLELIGPAFTIAMLGAIESLLSAVVADGMTGTRHDSNQELIGQGLANLAAPLFGGFAATGAIARTATNIRYGATSPLSGLVHAATLVGVLLVLAPLAAHVPLAVLAAVLFVVAWNMSELRHFVRMVQRAPRADVGILLVTFLLTVFADLVVAVNIGVILATLHFLRRMSASVEVRAAGNGDISQELVKAGLPALPPDVLVYTLDGPFFFGAVENFERALGSAGRDPRVLVIYLRWVPFMDITGLLTLADVIEGFRKRGVTVLVAGANARVAGKLERAGIVDLVGIDHHYATLAEALADLSPAGDPAAPKLL